MNVHLLVNELCEYQNARCNDKNTWLLFLYFMRRSDVFSVVYLLIRTCLYHQVIEEAFENY